MSAPAALPWMQNDALFTRALRTGVHYERMVAHALAAAGLRVTTWPTYRLRETVADAPAFANVPDVVVADTYRVEVKGLSRAWTRPSDFPFARPFIDTVTSFDAKTPAPFAYVFVSQPTLAVAVSFTADRDAWWTVERHRDAVRDIETTFYTTTRERLHGWSALVDALREGDR